MIGQSFSEGLDNLESEYEIDIVHKIHGTSSLRAPVIGANTLGQVLREYAADIGINPNDSIIIFENKQDETQTSNKHMTLAEFGLNDGDILSISSYSAFNFESVYEIDIMHRICGATYRGAFVIGANILYQVLQEYAKDIGINPNDSKIIFENKRTGKQTSDKEMTIAEFELIGGDILSISSDCACIF